MLNAYPNILGEDRAKNVHYSQDVTHYYYLDPTHKQTTNIFFMENTIEVNDAVWDIFEFTEREVNIFEKSYTQQIPSLITPGTAKADRVYMSINLRADE